MKIKVPHPFFRWTFLILGILFLPSLAKAHSLHGESNSLLGGFQHPLHGFDHIVAMIAVGIWAAQLAKKATLAVPFSFITIMTLGGFLGVTGIKIPFVEEGIIISVLALGVLIAASIQLPLTISMFLVGFFAIFHGHAHGSEMTATNPIFYVIGFTLSTVFLHAIGIFISLAAQRLKKHQLLRYAGSAIAIGSIFLCFH